MSILSIFISKLLPPMPFNFEMKKRKQFTNGNLMI